MMESIRESGEPRIIVSGLASVAQFWRRAARRDHTASSAIQRTRLYYRDARFIQIFVLWRAAITACA